MEIPPEAAVSYDSVAGTWPETITQRPKKSGEFNFICSSERLSELTYKNKRFVFHRNMTIRVMQEEDG